MNNIKPIHNEKEYEGSLKRIEELWGAKRKTPQGDEFEILLALTDVWEREHYPIPPPTPIQAIEFQLDQRGLTRSDLAKMLGSRSRVSEILSGKRKLTLPMIKRLHRELGVPAETLLSD